MTVWDQSFFEDDMVQPMEANERDECPKDTSNKPFKDEWLQLIRDNQNDLSAKVISRDDVNTCLINHILIMQGIDASCVTSFMTSWHWTKGVKVHWQCYVLYGSTACAGPRVHE